MGEGGFVRSEERWVVGKGGSPGGGGGGRDLRREGCGLGLGLGGFFFLVSGLWGS